jgi:uncharacterized cupredoxin-like copper-binding protein
MKRKGLVLALAAVLLFTACGGGAESEGTEAGADSEEISFGTPADPSEADREVEVTATDELRFEPESIEVEKGETVTFVVTNQGTLDHEFVLGDPDFQEDQAAEAGGHGGHNTSSNSVHVPPGETQKLTWTFSQSVEVQYACHVDDHFGAGMLGSIEVAS